MPPALPPSASPPASQSRNLPLLCWLGLWILSAPILLACPRVHAQDLTPRFGAGIDVLVNPGVRSLSKDAVGMGLRFRGSIPVNADLSLAADFGFYSFFFSGARDAETVLNPQLSVILTFPRTDWSRYFLIGTGGMVPFSDREDVEGAFALHAGYGLVRLLSESQVFVEINPNLLVRPERVVIVFPLRAGIIF